MQNLAEFVTEKGGGHPVHRGRELQPAELQAGRRSSSSCRSSWPRPATRPRSATRSPRSGPELTVEGRSQPDLPVRRRRGRQRADLAEPARAVLVPRGPPQEAGRARAGRAPDADRLRRASCRSSSTSSSAPASRCSTPSTTPGAGGSGSATATSAGSGSRRSGSWRDRSCWARSRPRSRPIAAAISGTSRSRSGSGSPTPAIAPPRGEVDVQVERKGHGPRKLTLKRRPGSRNLFEGALPQAAEGEYEVRLLPPPVLEGPIPTDHIPRRPAGRRDGADPDERARADPRGRRSRGASSTHPDVHGDTARRPPQARRRSPSTPTRRSRSGTPGRSSVCSWRWSTAEWILRKRKQMV